MSSISSEDLIASKEWIKDQRRISADKGECFCISCKKSMNLIEFSNDGLRNNKCKACRTKYNAEQYNKRKALSDEELREKNCKKRYCKFFQMY